MPLTTEISGSIGLLADGADWGLTLGIPLDSLLEAVGLPRGELDAELAGLLDLALIVRTARVQCHADEAGSPWWLSVAVSYAAELTRLVILSIEEGCYQF